MRNISANGLAKLATSHGTEPIFILEVDWVKDTTAPVDRNDPVISDPVISQTYILPTDGIMSWHVEGGSIEDAYSCLFVDGTRITANGPYADPPGNNYSGLFGTLAPGTHYYTIVAWDGAGGFAQSSGSFTVDGVVVASTAPVISEVVVVGSAGTITWHTSGSVSCELLVDGELITPSGPVADAPGDNFSGTFSVPAQGTHLYTIMATGSNGVKTQVSGSFLVGPSVAPSPTIMAVYADREVLGVPGKIVEIGDLDNVVNVSGSGGSQELSVTLDDTDGSIKSIFDAHDIHKRDARVYQYFSGLDLDDKFLLFAGKISSPISWSERDRTVKFSVISQLEDKEVGFSAEEGQFPYLPADLVGKAWPMIFGTCINVPCLQINQAVTGTTLNGIGIISGESEWGSAGASISDDSAFRDSLVMQNLQYDLLQMAYQCWRGFDDKKSAEFLDQANKVLQERYKAIMANYQQRACQAANATSQISTEVSKGSGGDVINILGGEDFPQGQTITIDINGGKFTGVFNGTLFTIYSRLHPENDTKVAENVARTPVNCSPPIVSEWYKLEVEVPPGSHCDTDAHPGKYVKEGWITPSRPSSDASSSGSSSVAEQFWAEAGATVTISSSEPIAYIASIVWGRVLAVKAYKQFEGERRLVDVPANLYTTSAVTYGVIGTVTITLDKPLSTIVDQGWSDDLFVTFESIVYNAVGIMEFLIATYTDLTWDTTSFEHVKAVMSAFPANFAILERKNIIEVLQEIAFQSRCAIWLSNGVFYLKYLPEEPTPVDTITVSDLDAEAGVEVNLTPTEDLVTKMKITWKMSWAPLSDRANRADSNNNEKTIILRHNVQKYGVQESDYDWYIYNQPDIVYKAATFWLIRNSITWKTIKFKTFLNKLNLETFDAVTLDFDDEYVSTGPILAIVEKATYNSADNCVDVECALPVQSGEMTKYPFYWPSALPLTTTWPPASEVGSGNAGGGGIGAGAVGVLPIGDTSRIPATAIFVGGPNVVFGPQSDQGDSTPTDVGFVAKTVVDPAVHGWTVSKSRPRLDLSIRVPKASKPMKAPVPPLVVGGIDIHKTIITDSSWTPSRTATLCSLIKGITNETKGNHPDLGEGSLMLQAEILVGDTDNPDGKPFSFKYDEDGEQYGAKIAFLKD